MRIPRLAVPRVTCLVGDHDDLDLLPALAEAGVDGFQVRAPGADTRTLIALTCRVLAAVADTDARVLVNDRVDVAIAAGAHGAHLGSNDLPMSAARRLAPDLLLGATCRDRSQATMARAEGADYAGFGPVHATTSKAGLPAPLGWRAVRAASTVLPLVAIGGITADNAAQARGTGAHGVAVIGGIWRQPDPVQAAKELVAAVA
ncbi:thiamine phosphate synthase [Nocardioides sp. BGMRC 2183]|nr:thiamine phosphate synthase [Nocardioides sp. BGMRC 2183]